MIYVCAMLQNLSYLSETVTMDCDRGNKNLKIMNIFTAATSIHKIHLRFCSKFPFLIPLKTSEKLWFYDVFRGTKRELWEEIG